MANTFKTPNATEVNIDVVGSSIFGVDKKISVATTYNCFISDDWVISFPGYKRVRDFLSSGEGRTIYHCVAGNFMIVVVSSKVYRIEVTGQVIEVGTLETYVGEVFADENLASQICIVDGFDAYIYYWEGAPLLTRQNITANNAALIPGHVEYHNRYFLFSNDKTNSDRSKWFIYESTGTTTIARPTGIGAFQVEIKPDSALAIQRIPGQSGNILVFGRAVAEVWTQVGGFQAYRRNSTISVDSGCISRSTVAASDEHIFWLGVNETNAPVIMQYKEGAKKISTDGISYLMQKIQRPDESTASIYRQDGHLFYVLTFFNSLDNISIAYDVTKEKFYHMTDWKLDYFPSREMVYFNKSWWFVSIEKPSLYEMNPEFVSIDESLGQEITSDYIYPMQRIRRTSPIRVGSSARFRVNTTVVTIEQGMRGSCSGIDLTDYIVMEDDETDIITTEQGDFLITEQSQTGHAAGEGCPRIDLSFSKDGGYTWSNIVGRELQPLGHRPNILSWRNLGVANEFTYQFRYWGLTKFNINNAVAEIY